MKLYYRNLPDGTKKLIHMTFEDGKIFDEVLEGDENDIGCIEANNCVFDGDKVIVTEQNKKKKEARELIEKYMKQHDQINTIFEFVQEFHDIILTQTEQGSLTKNAKMKDSWRYINEVLLEYRTNGEESDYSNITPPIV